MTTPKPQPKTATTECLNTKGASVLVVPKQPDKRAFRPLKLHEVPQAGDLFDRFGTLETHGVDAFLENAALLIDGESPLIGKPLPSIDVGNVYREVGRPLAQPKRAKKRLTVLQMAKNSGAARAYIIGDIQKTIFREGYLAGWRAARRRAGGAS